MAKEATKIHVKATEDFFDTGNYQERRKGDEFVLKSDYAKSLGKLVTNTEAKAKPTKEDKKKVAKEKANVKLAVRKEKNSNSGPNATKHELPEE